ncbi:hypothetical protein BH10PLA2_BH10PLA2_23940 [soil metagenome]
MPFRYLTDPLFLFCLITYAANRWILKPYVPNEFSQSYLNDLICLPFWIPIMLWTMKCLGLRKTQSPPSGGELIIPLLIWSFLFEVYLPSLDSFKEITFSDPMDILCYTTGALLAAVFWNLWYREGRWPKRAAAS